MRENAVRREFIIGNLSVPVLGLDVVDEGLRLLVAVVAVAVCI